MFGYTYSMAKSVWRDEVAALLERCARSLRAQRDRQAVAEFGMTMAYLMRAKDAGESIALVLLAQTTNVAHAEQTQRFSFVPGELEKLTGQRNSQEPPAESDPVITFEE